MLAAQTYRAKQRVEIQRTKRRRDKKIQHEKCSKRQRSQEEKNEENEENEKNENSPSSGKGSHLRYQDDE
eukprot:739864-Amorphochlora_amoeboformis.AAC.1